MKTIVSLIKCQNHKDRGTCAKKGCMNMRKSRGKCKKCKKTHWRKMCHKH